MALDLSVAFYTIAGEITIGEPFPPSPHGFRELCEAAGAAGYAGIGMLSTDYQRARDSGLTPADLRAILADNGLRTFEMEFLSGWYLSGDALERSRHHQDIFFRAADEIGVRLIKGGVESGDFSRPLDEVAERFAEVSARAASHGTRFALEPSPFSACRDLGTAMAIVGDAGPGGGLMLDIWHVTRCGIPYADLAALPASIVVGVEIDDALEQVVGDLWSDTIDHRLLPGDGDFDIAGFVRAIDATGYTGPITVEVLNRELRRRPLREVAVLTFERSRAAILAVRRNGG